MFGLMKNEFLFGENGRFSYVSLGLVSNKPRAYMKQAEMLRGQIQGIVELSTGEDDSNESHIGPANDQRDERGIA